MRRDSEEDLWISAIKLLCKWNSDPMVLRSRSADKASKARRKMGRLEALFRQIQTLAFNEGAGAACLLHQLRKDSLGNAPIGDPQFFVFGEVDLKQI